MVRYSFPVGLLHPQLNAGLSRHSCRALFPFRTAVRAGVPGEERHLRQIQFIHHVRHTARMLMTAMNQDDGTISGPSPVTKEYLYAVMCREETLFRNP